MAIVRIEQIAPFPYHYVLEQLKLYPNAEVSWVQEEHRNQGPWTYVQERLEHLMQISNQGRIVNYIGRKISGSTAVGSANTHKLQLEELLKEAFQS